MKILGTYYGRCDAGNWKEAEQVAMELLEEMDFTDVQSLSQHDSLFPFDYVATKIHRTCICDCFRCEDKCLGICDNHVVKGENYLIDVTLRPKKPVMRKRLSAWRTLGYETTLLILLPEKLMAVLIKIEPQDKWVNLTPSMIWKLEKEFRDSFIQTRLSKA